MAAEPRIFFLSHSDWGDWFIAPGHPLGVFQEVKRLLSHGRRVILVGTDDGNGIPWSANVLRVLPVSGAVLSEENGWDLFHAVGGPYIAAGSR